MRSFFNWINKINTWTFGLTISVFFISTQNGFAQADVAPLNCPIESAPKLFQIKNERTNKKGYPKNQGIVPKGFVGYKDGTPVVHGVDVSKWQNNGNFKKILNCGGKFAFIRLSAGMNPDNELEYRVHWANARGAGLLPGPYHFLAVPALSSELPKNEAEEARYLVESAQAATAQAELFVSRLREVLALEPVNSSQKTNPFLPIVLALGSAAPTAINTDTANRYGKFYTVAACKWLEVVKDKLKIKADGIMLFTYPYIYNDYGFEDAPCGIKNMPIWIAGFSADGSRFSTDEQIQKIESKVCIRNGTNRCRFQLYSSYGGFAQFDREGALDLDRFHGTEQELNQLLQTLPR